MKRIEQGIGTCGVPLFLAIVVAFSSAQTLTTLHSFNQTDGANPAAPLLQFSAGAFYGTTSAGGTHGEGTVFEIKSDGSFTTVHNFGALVPTNGLKPGGALLLAKDGMMWSTTTHGGNAGVGTIFRMNSSGTVTTMASLIYLVDGAVPDAALVQARNGIFYGTAMLGGNSGAGTVFQVTEFGHLTPLYVFGPVPANGSTPLAPVIVASDGNLYGTAFNGGVPDACGTVFKLTPGGVFTLLHSFRATDGCQPAAGLVQGSDGNLYGVASTGGAPNGFNAGTIFRISLTGQFNLLHVFDGSDGAGPWGTLIQASDGNFYGTTEAGGAHSKGTIFRVTPAGAVTTLYSFCAESSCHDGAAPTAGLVEGSDGNLYGTTPSGGSNNDGTVFELSGALGP